MIRTTITLALVALLDMPGCRTQPCGDCDIAQDAGDDDDDDAPLLDLPDFPCGGADLMTDNLNCGACGHACIVDYPGTKYEAGICTAGACGPNWSDCAYETGLWNTCAELCAAYEVSCVSNGCSGHTGLLFELFFEDPCAYPDDTPPVATMTGACDQPIPWMSAGEYPRQVMCCCEFDY